MQHDTATVCGEVKTVIGGVGRSGAVDYGLTWSMGSLRRVPYAVALELTRRSFYSAGRHSM